MARDCQNTEGMLLTAIAAAQNELQFIGSVKRFVGINNARSCERVSPPDSKDPGIEPRYRGLQLATLILLGSSH